MLIPDIDFDPRTRVIFGAGTLRRVGELARLYGGSRVLLVTDHGLRDAGHATRGLQYLEEAGLAVELYDEVHPNPTTRDVEAVVDFARPRKIDLIVGLGGGSSLDCAKGANFLLTNGGKMHDYHGTGKATQPMLPLIAIPTTAGTGSDAQSYAVIADADTHMKMACGDKKAAARVAILDPELTVTMPRSVAAATGIDAISHAVESYVTLRRNPVSQLFARKAWQLLCGSFSNVLQRGDDLEARGAMLLGAHFAGAAIENSMLGATHALSNPLSAHFDLVHGIAIGILLPHVVRFNGEDPAIAELYGHLAADAGLCELNDPQAVSLLADRLTQFVREAEQPETLSACNVDETYVPRMAEEAFKQWTAQFNPRAVNPASLQELYRSAFESSL